MHLGYVLLYVNDVAAAVAFYEAAFGLAPRFLHESGQYAEMETGATALGFVHHDTARQNAGDYVAVAPMSPAPGLEIALTTADVPAAVAKAVAAGAALVSEPQTKPWGQTVAYVRDLNGFLVELCTPMGG